MSASYAIPIGIYAGLALAVLLLSKRAGGLYAALVASYCGVIVTSFTGGASGGVWLVQLVLVVMAPFFLLRPTFVPFGSRLVTLLTYGMFAVYVAGVVVGAMRYDPSLEMIKAGRFQTFFNLPIQFLMAGYRLTVIGTLFLAFSLPLRYVVDRALMVRALTLCWVFTLVLAILGVLDYFDVANLAFSYRREAGFGHVAVLGFHRATIGMMLVMGIFLSFAMTQLSRGHVVSTIAYVTGPILFIATLFTWSRGATLSMAVGAISLALTLGGTRAIKGVLVTLFGAGAVYAVLSRFPDVQERFTFFLTGGPGVATAGRLEGWSDLVAWLFHNPAVLVTGAGFQNFNYYVHIGASAVELEAAHNNYLHTLTETGFIGLGVFIAWLVSIFGWLAAWRFVHPDRATKTLSGIFMSLMIAMAVSCITQESLAPSPSMVPLLLHFYLILGLWISYYRTQMAQG